MPLCDPGTRCNICGIRSTMQPLARLMLDVAMSKAVEGKRMIKHGEIQGAGSVLSSCAVFVSFFNWFYF